MVAWELGAEEEVLDDWSQYHEAVVGGVYEDGDEDVLGLPPDVEEE